MKFIAEHIFLIFILISITEFHKVTLPFSQFVNAVVLLE